MLPTGVKTGDQGGQHGRGQAHLPVTVDGRTSMLSVTVSLPSEMNRSARKNFDAGPEAESNEHLPDGTLVIIRESGATKSGGGPAVSWNVEAFHPDGTRVTVAEWNGENGYTFRPDTPALTTDQLKAIAVDPAWRP
ncbi:hypothetical protein GCM10010193_47050 [Kitasatospora atroaurantiaca]|uniref:DUF4367 domain-containing protein n=2 Tax=Kitasatospora atroaurantiaca TaxID=285545 RepID=A0A561EZ77_9ACTN|nr:hypothetical protein FB465_6074 [Kitasatospora atroaurantiaca]